MQTEMIGPIVPRTCLAMHSYQFHFIMAEMTKTFLSWPLNRNEMLSVIFGFEVQSISTKNMDLGCN